jgi:hypothetical protein
MQHFGCNGAEQCGPEAAASSCGHHDQVETRLPGHFHDARTSIALFDHYLRWYAGEEILREEFQALAGFVDQAADIQIRGAGSFNRAIPQDRDFDEIHQR